MTLRSHLRSLGFPEFIDGELHFAPVPPKCAVCHGLLVGDEVRWGTCGHDGGRSISRRDVPASQLTHPGELLEEGT